ncbi:MAG: PAS domain-containing protein, partial [Bacillota bacterium]
MSNKTDTSLHSFPFAARSASTPSGLLNINLEGKIVYANNTILELFGLPAGKVLGTNLLSLFIRLFRKQGFPRTWEWLRHIYQPDAYLVSFQNNQGEMVKLKITVLELAEMGFVVVVDRCEPTAPLSQIGNVIVEQLPIPLILIRSDGRIGALNQAFETLTQGRALDFYGRSVADLDGLVPGLPAVLLHTLYEAQPMCETVRLTRNKRSVFKLETRPITVWGKVRAVIGCLHPLGIGETYQRSELSGQNHNLISDLVEETAHRVRNPLTVVKGFIQLYKDDPKNIPWDLLLAELSGIERTLQDLMVLSRNYRDKTERVNLNQIIAELFPA